MKQGYLIGADIGTTRAKCYLYRTDGTLLRSAVRSYPSTHDSAVRCEQSAEDWWSAFTACVRECCGAVADLEHVLAICLSTQGGTLVPVDADGKPLRPAIVWSDSRCEAEREILCLDCSPAYIFSTTGWSLSSGLNALQILWLKRNDPEVFQKTERFLSVPDFMSLRMTGRAAVDASNAGINQLADVRSMTWDEKILKAVGIGAEQLGEIVQSGDIVGPLTQSAADALGLSTSTLVVAGGHDQYCAALGAGAIRAGDVFIATGTCWVVAGVSEQPSERCCFSRHTVPGLWGALISQESGGSCLEWFRSNLCSPDANSYEDINRRLAAVDTGDLLFYPFFSGISYPKTDAHARAAFRNLSLCHGRDHMGRAILEGVCAQVAWMLDAFRTGAQQEIKMVGGATNSPLWVQIMADTLNLPIAVPHLPDVGCAGAAILAGVSIGAFESYQQGVDAFSPETRVVLPDKEVSFYQNKLQKYKRDFKQLFEAVV